MAAPCTLQRAPMTIQQFVSGRKPYIPLQLIPGQGVHPLLTDSGDGHRETREYLVGGDPAVRPAQHALVLRQLLELPADAIDAVYTLSTQDDSRWVVRIKPGHRVPTDKDRPYTFVDARATEWHGYMRIERLRSHPIPVNRWNFPIPVPTHPRTIQPAHPAAPASTCLHQRREPPRGPNRWPHPPRQQATSPSSGRKQPAAPPPQKGDPKRAGNPAGAAEQNRGRTACSSGRLTNSQPTYSR